MSIVMQNEAAIEALYSATFVQDYLDTVENLPNELQQHLSALREMDLILYKDFLSELDSLIDSFEKESSVTAQRQILQKIEKGLILAKGVGDEKLILAQVIADTIENRSRILEHDSRNLEFDDNENEDPVVHSKPSHNRSSKNSSSSANVSGSGLKSCGQGRTVKRQVDDKGEKTAVKRRKKQNHEKQKDDPDEEENHTSSTTTTKGSSNKSRGSSSVGNSNSSSKKSSTKRKSSNSKKMEKDDDLDLDPDLDPNLVDIDPDEPTYCLCDQVSYGDMIGCDNDLCPLEWFHFQCVNLTNKPKGKWFCPKCRGDKPTVMKPKSQFLKELEKFNKEKEEKVMRQKNN